MGKTELQDTKSNIIEITCGSCHVNVIYLRVNEHESRDTPFNHSQFICTECNQGMTQNLINPD